MDPHDHGFQTDGSGALRKAERRCPIGGIDACRYRYGAAMNDCAAVASALFAAVGLIFTGRQLLLINQQARVERRVGLEGVVVSWRAVEAPNHGSHDGTAVWKYEVSVANPGRFPIDHVDIRWVFPCPVQRLHYNEQADPPRTELRLSTPVLAGGGQRRWTRRLRIDLAEAAALANTYAEVVFHDIDGQERRNRWPRIIR